MKRHHILFTVIGIIVGGIIIWWFLGQMTGEDEAGVEQKTTYRNEEVGFNVTYNSRLFEAEITETDKQNNVWLRLIQPNLEDPFQVTIRTETGKQVAASTTGKSTHELILESAKLSYPGEYNQFEIISERKFEVNSHQAAELIFSYESEGIITQRFVVVEKDEDTVVYISAQAKQEDFETINNKYFEDIISSTKF